MKLKELLKNVSVKEVHADPEMDLCGISCDSRTVKAGQMYAAVRGYAADGHDFIGGAIDGGAAAILCEQKPDRDIPYVLTEDSRKAMADVAANFFGHPSEKMTVIGVTGTNGKTTSTFLIKSALETLLGAKVGLIGTIQNMIGEEVIPTERTTPESIEVQELFAKMLAAGCKYVVMEVSSHALYLHRVRNIDYDIGVFTNLTEDHLDFHGTMENYCDAKKILFGNCKKGVFNADDPWMKAMAEGAKCSVKTYGITQAADYAASDVRMEADSVHFCVEEAGRKENISLGIPGKFSVYNALAVIGTLRALDIPMTDIAKALSETEGVKGRVEVVPTPGKDYTVLIDYAHTPDGLENVLSSVQGFCKGRVIAVFGCGGDRDPYKRPIMGKIGVDNADFVVFTSDNPRTEDPDEILKQIVAGAEGSKTPYVVIENRRKAIRWAMDHAEKDDIIVLAGKGHETYQILGKEKTHLDEREEVAAHLQGN